MTWVEFASAIIHAVGLGFAAYALAINLSFVVLTGLAVRAARRQRLLDEFAGFDAYFLEPEPLGVSILIPAHNEETTIVSAVQAMRAQRYPEFEVIVVDDGSTDRTRERLIETFGLEPAPLVVGEGLPTYGPITGTYVAPGGDRSLALVTKSHGGKADALNAGMNVARHGLVCLVDADSLLDPDGLLQAIRPFHDDPCGVVATVGAVRVGTGCEVRRGRVTEARIPRGGLTRIQVVEYVRSFVIGRAGWSMVGGLAVISGSFGVFRSSVVRAVGGMATDCVGEDADLVVRVHRWLADRGDGGRIAFVPGPVAWTEVPADRRTLALQRRRWHRGLSEVLTRHRSMLFRRRYGVLGMLTLPWFWLFELFAPVVELLGIAYLVVVLMLLTLEGTGVVPIDFVDWSIVLLIASAALAFAAATTLVALVGDEINFGRYRSLGDQARSVLASAQEHLGYRQLTAWWRLRGLIDAKRHAPAVWGEMKRNGFGDSAPQPPVEKTGTR